MAEPKHILIIENNESEREELGKFLSALGYGVEKTATSDEGLKCFRQSHHDLAIVEVLIPGIGGLATCKLIKEQGTEWVKVIVTSKLQQSRSIRDSATTKFKADAFLQKPFEIGILAKQVADLIGPGDPDYAKAQDRNKPDAEAETPRKAPEPAKKAAEEPPRPPAETKRAPEPIKKSAPPPRPADEEKSEKFSTDLIPQSSLSLEPEGTFDPESFGRLLIRMMEARYSGALRVDGPAGAKQIFFIDGIPVFVQSNIREEALGRLLLAEKRISDEIYRDIIVESSETGRKIGSLLLSRGIMDSQELAKVLQDQTSIKIANIFGWPEGRYKMAPETTYPPNAATFEASPEEIILLACRKYVPTALIENEYQQSKDKSFKHFEKSRFDKIFEHLTPPEAKLFETADEKTSYEELLGTTSLDTISAKRVIHAFLLMNLIQVTEKKLSSPQFYRRAFDAQSGERKPDDSAEVLFSEINEISARLDEMNYFEFLEIPLDAASEEIKTAISRRRTAYNLKTLKVEPPAGIHRRVQVILKHLDEVEKVLTDPQEKRRYVRTLEKGPEPQEVESAEAAGKRKKMEAEATFQKGLIAFEKRHYAFAKEAFERAVTNDPTVAEYHARAGYSLFKMLTNPIGTLDEALEQIVKGMRMEPENVEFQIMACEILRHQGKDEAALRLYQKVLEADPKNEEAKRQVHYLGQQIEAKREKEKDGIKSFFGKTK